MAARAADLTAAARIRNAALEGFARDGVASTSIRDVAEMAGVSPGLVQHHFPTKEALREAVNQHVIAIAQEAVSDLPDQVEPTDAIAEVGDRLTAVVRDHPSALRYVARSAADGDEAALRVFDGFVALGRTLLGRMADNGLLHPDLDLDWAALHVVVMNLGTMLLEGAVDRQLPEPFRTAEELERWNLASTALFARGIRRPEGGGRRR